VSFICQLISKRIIAAKASLLRVHFCHVPKCGGSSASAALRSAVVKGASKGSFSIPQEEGSRVSKILQVPAMRTREIYLSLQLADCQNVFGTGHSHCRPCIVEAFKEEWAFVTILRNPIDRWISEYVYSTYKASSWDRNELPIEEYLWSPKGLELGRRYLDYFSDHSEAPNSTNLSHYVTQAVDTLSSFRVVGALEIMPAWKDAVQAEFGIQISLPTLNRSPCPEEQGRIYSDKKLMKKITKFCQYDMEIYEQSLKSIIAR